MVRAAVIILNPDGNRADVLRMKKYPRSGGKLVAVLPIVGFLTHNLNQLRGTIFTEKLGSFGTNPSSKEAS